jgi:CDGSH-type Zn-finger protein
MQESVALARRNGALKVLPLPNGPLKIQGALEIVSGTGHTINRVMETYLCRCGGSANKPYCDGTHAKIGFKAP